MEFCSPEELAERFKVPVRTVYMWRVRGTGPKGYRIGRHVRYRLKDIESWLETRADQPKESV